MSSSTKRITPAFTDESIRATIAEKRAVDLPVRYDEVLLSIHPDDRLEATMAAQRFVNMSPDAGRPSDALRAVASDYRRWDGVESR